MAKDPYKFQRAMNKVSNFVWSFMMRLAVIAVVIVVIVISMPWLKSLWSTIRAD